ncbi:MAG TPA: hypothetical protein VGI84_03440 [Pseudonocardiaceae bacterium]
MADPDHRDAPDRGQPLGGLADELFGVSGDPGATGPIRAVPGETSPLRPPDAGGQQPPAHQTPAHQTPAHQPPAHQPPGYHPAGYNPAGYPPAGYDAGHHPAGYGATYDTRALPHAGPQPPPGARRPEQPTPPRNRFSARAVAVTFAALLVLVLAVVAVLTWPRSGATPAPPTTAAPAAPVVRTDTGAALVQRATRTDGDCAAHSYGQVTQFLSRTPCTSLRRALYTATSSQGPTVVSVSTVVMPSAQEAADLQQLTDRNGTGNVSDLLREGVRVDSGPTRMRDASYASRRNGATVVIVEAAATSRDANALDPLAQAALALGG